MPLRRASQRRWTAAVAAPVAAPGSAATPTPLQHHCLSISHAVLWHCLSDAYTLVDAHLLLVGNKHRHQRASPATFTWTETLNERSDQLKWHTAV